MKCFLNFLIVCFILIFFSPVSSQEKRKSRSKSCKNCFSVNFNEVDIKDWLKTMASLIRRNIMVDDSITGKITVISYKDIPERRALDFMKQVLEVKGYGIIEEPNLIKIVNQKKAGDASLPEEGELTEKSAGVISRVLSLPSRVDVNELTNVFKSVAGSQVTIVSYRPTNSIVITGFARNVYRALSIGKILLKKIDKNSVSSSGSEQVHIYRVRHIAAESLSGVLSKLDAPQSSSVITKTGVRSNANKKIRSVAHKASNSIVITSTSREWLEIRNIIKKLDVPRIQILLEVLIAEISSTGTNDFGVDWRSIGEKSAHAQFNTGLAGESRIIDPTQSTGSDSFIDPKRNTLNGFSLGFIDSAGDLLGILRANINRQNFNVLSSPQVLALNNQEAEINVGQDVPVRTRSQTSAEGTSAVESFEYKPAGIKLKVTPQINSSGQITLNFFAEISSIQGQQAAASGGNPTFSKRNVRTYAIVLDKQTIVLGGLISSETTKNVTKVPILGDIPLLGYFFRRNIDTKTKRNLMIFMTPHILKGRKEADRLTDLKRSEQQSSLKKIHDEIIVWPEKRW